MSVHFQFWFGTLFKRVCILCLRYYSSPGSQHLCLNLFVQIPISCFFGNCGAPAAPLEPLAQDDADTFEGTAALQKSNSNSEKRSSPASDRVISALFDVHVGADASHLFVW